MYLAQCVPINTSQTSGWIGTVLSKSQKMSDLGKVRLPH